MWISFSRGFHIVCPYEFMVDLVMDVLVDVLFRPLWFLDATAACIDYHYDMLCSTVAESNSEIEEMTIRNIQASAGGF